MKRRVLLLLVVVICILSSCHKQNNTPPVTPPKPSDTTFSINLYGFRDTAGYGKDFELIISEFDGTILLDSVASFNVPIAVTLKAHQPTVDVTEIIRLGTYYQVNMYRAVRPSQWKTVEPGAQQTLSYPISFNANMVYTNAPAVDIRTVYFSSLPAVTSSGIQLMFGYSDPTKLYIEYPGRPATTNYAYLELQSLGLFNYHLIQGNNDTVDLTNMDKATLVNLTRPSQYTVQLPYLYGYIDTSDFTKYQVLFGFNGYGTPIADIQYPPKNKVPSSKIQPKS